MSKLFNYGAGLSSVFAGSKAAGKTGGYLPGMITTSYPNIIEALNSSTAKGEIEFGSVIVRDVTGGVPFARPFVSGDTAGVVYGIAVKDVTSPTTISDNIIHKYRLGGQISVIRSGSVCVPVQKGTPTVGGQVYVRTAVDAQNAGLVIGGIEAVSVSGENVPVLGWTFESAGFYPTNASANGSTANNVTGLCANVRVCVAGQDSGLTGIETRLAAAETDIANIKSGTTAAGKATKLATARTISLSGAVTGSGEFDGSADVSIATTQG